MSDDATPTAAGFALPTGMVTFVMTDIEGSTRAWERSAADMSAAVARQYEILDLAVSAHRGVRPLEQGEGDSVVAAFSRASDAVAAAFDAQRALAGEEWPTAATLRVRMAVHTGEAQLRDQRNYFGPVVIRCARIRDLGHGGQVLVSDATAALVAGMLPAGALLDDLGVVRLKDLGRPERVWQLVHERLERDFPPLRGLDSFPQNLPAQMTPLIGRGGGITAVAALLDAERLVTLTGAGGVGKTRLALAVGAELIEHHPGGVWFVDLAGTGGPDTAGRAALRALRVVEAPNLEPARQVAVELEDAGRSLLILDNCEHTLDDAAAFAFTVLSAAPSVTVLATSREPMGVSGEVTWRVPSLPTPDGHGGIAIESLSQFDAVTLFLDRGRRARPSFRITDANAPAVAQICQHLDGIPLAIELAAARLRHLSAEQIATQLDDRFRLLVGGSRVVRPRQQTLGASVEWSHDLLSPDEQLVLRRLGVFTGRFELDAAEHVAAAADFDPVQVFDVVSRLVDKSLIVTDEDGPEVSYRMLETIRAFSVARAEDAGELTLLRDAHAGWWNRRLSGMAVTGPTDDLVGLVEAHHDDLVAALNWATDHDRVAALDLMWPLTRAYQGARSAGDIIPTFERLLGPEIERAHPHRWLRAGIGASVPLHAFRGRAAFDDLVGRCERVALELDDELYVALARWVANMNVESSRHLRDVARRRQSPYANALATVRLAIDACDQAPDIVDAALGDARQVAESYGSNYIREYAAAASGAHAAIYGDLPAAVQIGAQLAGATTPAIRRHGYELLLAGGLATGDEAALRAAVELAERDVRLGVVGAELERDGARVALALVRGQAPAPRAPIRIQYHPLIACRDAVDRGAADLDARALAAVAPASVVRHAYRHIVNGLTDADEDEWHAALDIALRHGVRPVAVDVFEGLAAIAATSDSSREALRLFGAAERLMDETGYRWRFPSERHRHDEAVARARADLGPDADVAAEEGRALDWRDAAGYARRARGERKRPRHGWDSLTPTEVRVVDLVAEGCTNLQIAERLLMSRSTVKTHLEHVFTKTGVRNRSELTAEVVRRRQGFQDTAAKS